MKENIKTCARAASPRVSAREAREAALEAKLAKPPPAPSPSPTPREDDFQAFEAFVNALKDWKVGSDKTVVQALGAFTLEGRRKR